MAQKSVDVDALRERAFRMAQSGIVSARGLADAVEQLHDYDGPTGWRRATKADGTKFKTFREYASYRNPPGLGFNADDGAADVDAIVSRLIQFDRNRPAIKHLGGSIRGTPSESRKGKRYAAKENSQAGACATIPKLHHSSVAGLADRLQRDFPKVWAAYQNGEHKTVNAAARVAGIVPDRHNPVREARQAWNRMTKAQRKTFREMVRAAGTGKIEKGLVTA
jgi:hypothetical protein